MILTCLIQSSRSATVIAQKKVAKKGIASNQQSVLHSEDP